MFKEIYYKYFNEEILPELKSEEDRRKKIIFTSILKSLFFFAAGLGMCLLFVYISVNNFFIPAVVAVILFLMYFLLLKGIISVIVAMRDYRTFLAENLFPKFLKPVANFKNWPKNHDIESVIDSNLFRSFESREDIASYFGIYKNVNITVSHTKFIIPADTVLFNGVLIQMELPFSIDNHIIMLSKNEAVYNRYRQVNPHIKDLNDFMYVFARKSNLQIINEELWNVIKKSGEVYNAKGYLFSLKGNVLTIGIRQKKFLQFGSLFRSLLKAENFDDLISRFTVIYEMIDVLVK